MKPEILISEVQGEVNDKQELDEFDVEVNCDLIMDIFKHYDIDISDYHRKRITDDLNLTMSDIMSENMQNTINDISSRIDDIEL